MIQDFICKTVQVLNTLHYKTQIFRLVFKFDWQFSSNFLQGKDNYLLSFYPVFHNATNLQSHISTTEVTTFWRLIKYMTPFGVF